MSAIGPKDNSPAEVCRREWSNAIRALDRISLDSQVDVAVLELEDNLGIDPDKLNPGRQPFSFGTPAWPAEWALKECSLLLPLIPGHHKAMAMGIAMNNLLSGHLITLFTRVRAALSRMPAIDNNPYPQSPPGWPRNTGTDLMGYSGTSCLDTTIKLLIAMDNALGIPGGDVFEFDQETWAPLVKFEVNRWDDPRIEKWTQCVLDGLDGAVFNRVESALILQDRINGYLHQLEDECVCWRTSFSGGTKGEAEDGDPMFRPWPWFRKYTTIRNNTLQMAARKDRKLKRIRSKDTRGSIQYSATDAYQFWPEKFTGPLERLP